MTDREKQLLIKDLSGRLSYGVIVNYKEGEYDFHKWKIETLDAPAYSESGLLIETSSDGWIGYTEYDGCGLSSASRALHLDKMLPYLRPMSSMTEEEFKEYHSMLIDVDNSGLTNQKLITKIVDWLDEKMFDHRGLIPKGLALEAQKGMYKIK